MMTNEVKEMNVELLSFVKLAAASTLQKEYFDTHPSVDEEDYEVFESVMDSIYEKLDKKEVTKKIEESIAQAVDELVKKAVEAAKEQK